MSSLLPPGFCFRPSEDQLLSYYLTNKNRTGGGAAAAARTNGYDFIRELDLYEYHPCERPETSCYDYCCNGPRRRHWYCYAEVRALAEGRRRAKGGFWVMTGKAKSVCGPEGGASIGTRTEFVYYSGESATSAVKTGWVLYEYALVDHFQASYVLCRVFFKSRFGNSVSEKLLGESLYPLVEQLEHDSAAKVTGMLLEMDQTEVLHLLESPDALKAKVAEAMNVLRSAAAQQQANNNADQLAWLSLNDSLVT